MLDWNNVRLFIAIARTGQLTKAARLTGLDQTTIARRLTRLEDNLGSKVFERTSRGLTLTAAGQALMTHAERIEAEFMAAEAAFGQGEARLSGVVRLATPEAFGTYVVAPAMDRFHRLHPDLRLELAPESQMVSLVNRDADIAVVLNPPPRGRIVARRLTDYRVGLYASPTYLARSARIESVSDLPDHPLAWYIEEMIDIPELHFLREIGTGVNTAFRSSSIVAQHEAVANGLGLGLLPRFSSDPDPRLERVLVTQVEVRRSYWLAMAEDRKSNPRVRAVADFLADLIAERKLSF